MCSVDIQDLLYCLAYGDPLGIYTFWFFFFFPFLILWHLKIGHDKKNMYTSHFEKATAQNVYIYIDE